ncbi:DnaD domain-containing protein [Alkalihalobacterium chitinilyticum]|uniref:DnaD domain-containing protein n=1 Tax=Alkalihalobacterium chitinilyticum TaxID=2980103 RepID=A0ABT5VBP7_9BACI|nr:DnaD domain-containing protein [Alkalihalobacterium chitinilyticum]MDE5411883.1 DnaD domain-containing protein [Alkalihalobacterium chitinilyticum]
MNKRFLMQWITEGQLSVPKLLLKNYRKIGLNEEEFVLLLQVYDFLSEQHPFPTPEDLSERGPSSSECATILGQLLKKGYLSIEEHVDENGILFESYSIDPLWEKLIHVMTNEKIEQENELKKQEEFNIYTVFEQEFSRPLSPIECETLAMWLDQDHHSPEIIRAALRESVVSGKLNFRYIDRILFEWKKNGVQTLQQARAYGEKFRKYQQSKQPTQEKRKVEPFPTYNWLEK